MLILKKQYIEVESNPPLLNECKHFIEAFQNNKKPRTDTEEAIRVLEVLIGTSYG